MKKVRTLILESLGGGEQSAFQILCAVHEKGRYCGLGAIYSHLDKLANEGRVSVRLGGPLTEGAGRKRKYYSLIQEDPDELQ